eukprot:TRINITY_DN1710_c0_g1_i1.p1 TRINITY_DN1710_c0_g1~~TRINITY_DN1710_c0_g1_i1.p1  ORF type:complete len:413 (+),score=111.84 TRINITY_DN1710_c0_g1_i1:86-1324(+)
MCIRDRYQRRVRGPNPSTMTFKAQVAAVAGTVLIVGAVFVALSGQTASSSAGDTMLDASSSGTTMLDLKPIEFTNANPSGHVTGANKCSASQLSAIKKGVEAAKPNIKRALETTNSALFTKWFGKAPAGEPDSEVHTRLQRGYDKFSKTDDWESECCPASGSNSEDECARVCTGSTMAFVMSATYSSGKKLSYNQIRFCASSFELLPEQLGFVIFHENVHLVSSAKDGTGDYSKAALANLAITQPELARKTANSYMLYAMSNGIQDHAEYEQVSAIAGSSLINAQCKNKFSNCASLVNNGDCQTDKLGNGDLMVDACCEACTMLQPVGSAPPCNDKYSNCNDLGSSGSKCSSGTLSTGETIGVACCKSCAGKCNDKYSNCDALASSSSKCSSGKLTSGEDIGTACCKSCTGK